MLLAFGTPFVVQLTASEDTMNDDRTRPSRSIRIERAARAVLAAYDACSHHNDEHDEREYLRQENALLDAADALRKELL